MANNAFTVLQDDIYRRLFAEPYFVDVGVFKLRDGTIQAQIDAAVRGLELQANKAGAAVSVLMAQMRVPDPNVPGPQFNAQITIRCQEYPDINFGSSFGARKSAEELATEVTRHLQFKGAAGFYSALYFERDAGTPNYDYLPLVTYDVTALSTVTTDEMAQVAMPTIGLAGSIVTLSCATAGAAIIYTTDDSMPAPANGSRAQNGTTYAAPFDANGVPGGLPFPLRVAAWKIGLAVSDVNRQEIN